MRKLLNPDTPIDSLFEVVGGNLTYVGSLPRGKVLNKIMYLHQLLFHKEASNCHLTPRDLELDSKCIAYSNALKKGVTEEEQRELHEVVFSWTTWIQTHLRGFDLPSSEQVLNKYFSTFDPHLCSDYQTKPQCNAITQGAACYS